MTKLAPPGSCSRVASLAAEGTVRPAQVLAVVIETNAWLLGLFADKGVKPETLE
jgi:hypothetical protein